MGSIFPPLIFGHYGKEWLCTMLWIRICMDPDPAKYEKQININVISLWILYCVFCRTGRYLVGSSFRLNFRCFYFISKYRVLKYGYGSRSAWIQNFCLDQELGKFKAGSGSGINHSGSTKLIIHTGTVPVPFILPILHMICTNIFNSHNICMYTLFST